MPRKSAGEPTWFRMYKTMAPMIRIFKEDTADALLLAFEYMETHKEPDLSKYSIGTKVLFTSFVPELNRSIKSYNDAVEYGRKSQELRRNKEREGPAPTLEVLI